MKCGKVDVIMRVTADAEILSNRDLIKHIKACKRCSVKHGLILRISMATVMEEDIPVRKNFEKSVWDKIRAPAAARLFSTDMPRYGWAFATAAGIMFFIAMMAGILQEPGHGTNVRLSDAAVNIQEQKDISDSKASGIKETKTTDVKKNAQERGLTSPRQEVRKIAEIDSETEQNKANIMPDDAGQKIMDTFIVPQYVNTGSSAGYGGGSAGSMPVTSGIKAAGVKKAVQEKTAVEGIEDDNVRKDIEVYGNVFHPLNGESVTIKYRVKDPANVIMAVYDRKGRIVKRIYAGERQPGIYTETWNGSLDSGAMVGEGIYFIYLRVGITENRIKTGIIR